MGNPQQLEIISRGVKDWNLWRRENPEIIPDLTEVDFRGVNLHNANLTRANLYHADLSAAILDFVNLGGANLYKANLKSAHLSAAIFKHANLRHANLSGAILHNADLSVAILRDANLEGAYLGSAMIFETNLERASLEGADLSGASIASAIFGQTNLRNVDNLDSCSHFAPSTIDYGTLVLSGNLPISFLRGCGLPDNFIDYLPSLLSEPIQFYSCFISYSTLDHDFAHRLHTDLQERGVRCWFAPHKLQGGQKVHEQIDDAIRRYDRLLLIISKHSMESEWVRTEIAKARKRERQENRRMLFPVRLVDFEKLRDWECFDADTGKDSAREIREYFVPDFSNWKQHDEYLRGFECLLRDLKANAK